MSALAEIGLMLGGLALLLAGGRSLVEGAVGIAARAGVSPLLIGLTVVAWGTSAPELSLNSIAASEGRTGLVFGNLVGATICNIGLILGVASLLRSLPIRSLIIARELPVMLGFMMLIPLLAAIGPNEGGGVLPGAFARWEGFVLLAAFVGYSVILIRAGLHEQRAEKALAAQSKEARMTAASRRLWVSLIFILVGAGMLGMGGNLAADAAVAIATRLGVSNMLIGVTIVAIGTTLPELATTIMAVTRGHTDLAVGNIVGSCVFNLGCIYGVAAIIQPHRLPSEALVPLGTMLMLGLTVTLTSLVVNRRLQEVRLSRVEGLVLLAIYASFIGYQAWRTLA